MSRVVHIEIPIDKPPSAVCVQSAVCLQHSVVPAALNVSDSRTHISLVFRKAPCLFFFPPQKTLAVMHTQSRKFSSYLRTSLRGRPLRFCCRARPCLFTSSALEVIPYTLAENAGMNPISIVTELRSEHAKGKVGAGERVGCVAFSLLSKRAVLSSWPASSEVVRDCCFCRNNKKRTLLPSIPRKLPFFL